MHGRVKVRSSEEKAEAERKEKAEKVRVYREVTAKIFAKRAAGEHDEEALKLTRDILTQNPDIATLWNYRREIVRPSLATRSVEEGVRVCEVEQLLTQQCLRVNPKSYCVWLHRQWVLEHSPRPDWTSETNICDLFLKYDERNFHCWDYRRFVTSKADVSMEEEFRFTHEKIAANFSNYSAWHYRSKLLPSLHPSPDRAGGVEEDALLQEHELAQNAFFTDPSDQSAWLYHRWLLGKTEQAPAVSCILNRAHPCCEAFVVFNQPIKGTQGVRITVGDISSVSSPQSDWPKSLWQFSLPDDVIPSNEGEFPVTIEQQEEVSVGMCDEGRVLWLGGCGPVFDSAPTAATSSVLEAELGSCQELLEMEPGNKWCLLTTLLLLQAVDRSGNRTKIEEMFGKLCTVDPYRRGYYQDMLSRFLVECSLADVVEDGISPSSPRALDLSEKSLSRLYHTDFMCHLHTLNLSNNKLTSLDNHIEHLVSLETLVVDDNKLEGLPSGMKALKLLRVLSIRNNNISDFKQLHCVMVVKVLRLEGNPLCNETDWKESVTSIVSSLRELDGALNFQFHK